MRCQDLRPLAAALLALSCAACAGTSLPTRYYVLTPGRGEAVAQPARAAEEDPTAVVEPTVVVESVRVPEHLARAQIARVSGSNRLELAEFDQWAAPLDRALAEVLAENLSLLVPSERALAGKSAAPPGPLYEVSVEVTRFDLHEDGRVELAAVYTVRAPGDSAPLVRRGLYRRKAAGEGYEAGVAAMSAAVLDLSRDVADAIR